MTLFGVSAALGAGLVTALAVIALRPRDDVPQDPDAIVVLGGAGPERVALGLELRDRYGAVLVLSSSAVAHGLNAGIDCRDDPRVISLRPRPRTTAGEARMVTKLVEDRDWRHVTVATARFHTTRARVLFRQCLGDRVTVVGAEPGVWHRRTPVDYLSEALGTVAALTIRRAC
jgi:uncharacterized SAM-binding protein YcdF (DUF218 family)